MPKFKISPAVGKSYVVEASSLDAVTTFIRRTGKRNLFGVEHVSEKGPDRYYLDRGHGPLWRISLRAAANELGMGGFGK